MRHRSFLTVLSIAVSFCVVNASEEKDAELASRYEAAVDHAMKDRTESEISRNLTALVPTDHHLRWRVVDGRNQVLCVTWTHAHPSPGEKITLSPEQSIWVTAVPELRSFCKAHRRQGVTRTLRVEQLLGLPPNFKFEYFVEFWASPEDLVRPAPDPEVSDHEAELKVRPANRFGSVNETYLQWFNHTADISYHGKPRYPWTRLGYTYDWGGAGNHIGLSEFVAMGGATIEIASVSSTREYLGGL